MLRCSFELNGKPVSMVNVYARQFPAFSGLGAHANRREFACLAGVGANRVACWVPYATSSVTNRTGLPSMPLTEKLTMKLSAVE